MTATDVFGNSGQAQRGFVYDLPPTLTVIAPADLTVARPQVQINVSASDDDPSGTAILIYGAADYSGGPLLARGTNTLNTNLDFSAYDGGGVTLMIRALDSANQQTNNFRQVYVQSSSNFVEIASVSDGRIMDAQPTLLLYQSVDNGFLPPGLYGGVSRCRAQ